VFHFKKFSIDDSKAAMKIGTDAVLLGSWVECNNETRILDIGTGSGILALMMAQRNPYTHIDAVELDPTAARLAQHNTDLSPWQNQIRIFNASIQDFSLKTEHKYSLLICNPPFFTDSLKSPVYARNLARHNDSLPVTELFSCINKIIAINGKASFIIPAPEFPHWTKIAREYMLFPVTIALVKSSPLHKPHRVLVTFSHSGLTDVTIKEIVLYTVDRQYSNEYKDITKDFYLNF
jgi:tRNA1Val (adenine37-N6)-methyltransferase